MYSVEAAFWINSWDQGGTATSFHRRDIHPYVQKYATPEFLRGKRVLVPLCGKTNDMMWFREYADHVIGVELVEKAIVQFFSEQALPYEQVEPGRYAADKLTIFNRDFFALEAADVGHIDFIYDRAALVALPFEMRQRYIRKIDTLLPIGGQQLVITLDYAPRMETPPFSITPAEVESYYSPRYSVELVENPLLPEHRMVAKFNLDYLYEPGLLLTRQA